MCKGNILIVDDQPDNLNLLIGLLFEQGYIVRPAPSGKLALRSIQSTLPDLILLDIMMPEMDGYEVCTQLKASERTQDIPIIFISALHEVLDTVKAFSLGAADYITKPFQAQEVLVRVENQLRIKRLSEQLLGQNAKLAEEIEERQRVEEALRQASILEERNRMAREIHDTLAQAFTGILMQLGAASGTIAHDPEAAKVYIAQARDLSRSGLAEARRSVAALRPQLLEDGNLRIALKRLAAQMSSDTSTSTVCEAIGTAYPLPCEVENNLLRIGQEALTNAVKHACASSIRMELVYEPTRCVLRVQDNGRGLAIDSSSVSSGFGLLGIRERSDRIGAHLTIQSQPGQGTEVVVAVKRDS
jgi:two-component system, sensor histidine kinase and response regulator